MAWRGGKSHKPVWGSGASGSLQVLPRGLARKCPVDIFARSGYLQRILIR
ncbi:hypothetical protein [Desulfosporosinus orientis]|nr:hypothetical protein [Desulfosporosinus orientis]